MDPLTDSLGFGVRSGFGPEVHQCLLGGKYRSNDLTLTPYGSFPEHESYSLTSPTSSDGRVVEADGHQCLLGDKYGSNCPKLAPYSNLEIPNTNPPSVYLLDFF